MTDAKLDHLVAHYRQYTADNPYIMVVSKDFEAIADALAALRAERDQMRRIVMDWVDPFAVPDDVKQLSDELWAAEHARQALQGDTE